jgi:hypothetical protein
MGELGRSIHSRSRIANPGRDVYFNRNWAQDSVWAELVTSQLSERGIVDTVLFVFV